MTSRIFLRHSQIHDSPYRSVFKSQTPSPPWQSRYSREACLPSVAAGCHRNPSGHHGQMMTISLALTSASDTRLRALCGSHLGVRISSRGGWGVHGGEGAAGTWPPPPPSWSSVGASWAGRRNLRQLGNIKYRTRAEITAVIKTPLLGLAQCLGSRYMHMYRTRFDLHGRPTLA